MPLLMLAFGALQYDRGNMYATQTPSGLKLTKNLAVTL
jgi:hypothetical protein